MPTILYIGFGLQPYMRGGAITYQHSLMQAVRTRGWDVTFYFSAPRYSLRNKPHIKTWFREGIKYKEIIDSPIYYGHQQSPNLQCHHPVLSELTERIVADERPDIVHIHELQFHGASIIDTAKHMDIPIVKTMHNYYDLCPECNLMFKSQLPCADYDAGSRCVECMATKPLFVDSYKNMLLRTMPFKMKKRLADLKMKYLNSGSSDSAPVPRGVQKSSYSAQDYMNRRHYFVDRLNSVNVIHCSSHAAIDLFSHYGVTRDRMKVIPLSIKGLSNIERKPLRGDHYPVVFGYIGGKHFHKGYNVLIKAFSMLDSNRAKLIIYDVLEPDHTLAAGNIVFKNAYRESEINTVLQEIDVGIVPSIWEEIFGIIGIEYQKACIPVIGSNIGGIPEWLNNGANGFLVEPGDPYDLAKKMKWFVDYPSRISQIQRTIQSWKNIDAHCDEMLELYQSLL